MNKETIEQIVKEKSLIEEAMKQGENFLSTRGIYDDVDDFVYDDCNQIINLINEEDYTPVEELVKDLEYYKNKAKKFASLMYSHESCWNLRLPRTFTKVLGHDYTVTEWITARADFIAETIDLYVKYHLKTTNNLQIQ